MIKLFDRTGVGMVKECVRRGYSQLLVNLETGVLSCITHNNEVCNSKKLTSKQASELQRKLNLFTLSPTLAGECNFDELTFRYSTDRDTNGTLFNVVYMQLV